MSEIKFINVFFPDSTNKTFHVEHKRKINDIINEISESVNFNTFCVNFGLYHKDDFGNRYWLNDHKNLIFHDFLNFSGESLDLYFSFKFINNLDDIQYEVVSKYFFYHHLKEALYSGELELVNTDLCFELLAITLILNDEHKDIDELSARIKKIIPGYLFLRHPSLKYCINQITNYHSTYSESTKSDELMFKFVDKIIQLPFQLFHYFTVKDSNGTTATLGIGKDGIIECSANSKNAINIKHTWSEITGVRHSKSKVFFDITSGGTVNRSSFRRNSSVKCLSYDTANPALAKSIASLCKEIINIPYTMTTQNTLNESKRSNDKMTPSTLKKFDKAAGNYIKSNNHHHHHGEDEHRTHHNGSVISKIKRRPSINSNSFKDNLEMSTSSECINGEGLSRSPSHMSISSSNFNGSYLTNESSSMLDQGSIDSGNSVGKTLQEKQQLYENLVDQRSELVKEIKKLISEAVELCRQECQITGKVPDDYEELGMKKKLKESKYTLPIKLLEKNENVSAYEKKKAELVSEHDILVNMLPYLGKKFKKDKQKRIFEIEEELKDLEDKNAHANIGRSSSVGNLRYSTNIDDDDIDKVGNGGDSVSRTSTLKPPISSASKGFHKTHSEFFTSPNNDINNDNNENNNHNYPSMPTDPISRRRKTNPSVSTTTTTDSHDDLRHRINHNIVPNSASSHKKSDYFNRFNSTRRPVNTSFSSNHSLPINKSSINHGSQKSTNETLSSSSSSNLGDSTNSTSDISDLTIDDFQPIQNLSENGEAPTPTDICINKSSRTSTSTNSSTSSGSHYHNKLDLIRNPQFPTSLDRPFYTDDNDIEEDNSNTVFNHRDSRIITVSTTKSARLHSKILPSSPFIVNRKNFIRINEADPSSSPSNNYERRPIKLRRDITSRARNVDLRRSRSVEEVKITPIPENSIDSVRICKFDNNNISSTNFSRKHSLLPSKISPKPATQTVFYTTLTPQSTESLHTTISTKLTYHPSKKDVIPTNLTRGLQPSISIKHARNNSYV